MFWNSGVPDVASQVLFMNLKHEMFWNEVWRSNVATISYYEP